MKALVTILLGVFIAMTSLSVPAGEATTGKASKIDSEARAALRDLYAKTPAAKTLGSKAAAILVFPSITKAGFVVGGQYGEGALIKKGKTAGYYSTGGASVGFQAGAQKYGYALFFMKEDALGQLDKADGWEVGVGPNLVVIDEGMAKNITTTTTQHDIYAFIFSPKGLMAGVGLQGNKVSKITPK